MWKRPIACHFSVPVWKGKLWMWWWKLGSNTSHPLQIYWQSNTCWDICWKTKQADLMMVLKEVGESLKSLSTIVWGARMFLQNLMAIHPSIDNAIPWAMMLTWVKNLLSTQSSLCSYVLNQTANLGINRYNTQPPNVLCSQQSGR